MYATSPASWAPCHIPTPSMATLASENAYVNGMKSTTCWYATGNVLRSWKPPHRKIEAGTAYTSSGTAAPINIPMPVPSMMTRAATPAVTSKSSPLRGIPVNNSTNASVTGKSTTIGNTMLAANFPVKEMDWLRVEAIASSGSMRACFSLKIYAAPMMTETTSSPYINELDPNDQSCGRVG